MTGQPVSSPRTAGILLGLSYVLLVLVIAFGAFWIQDQFEHAQDQRCDLLAIQIKLAQLEVVILHASDPPPPPDVQADIDNRVDLIRGRVQIACPDTDLP
jgi:type II secretory pathway component PulM